MTKVEKSVEVAVPVRTAYNQWTQFEEFPQFMSGVQQVEQLDERTLRWVAEIAGVRRQWTATVLEQVPDQKVAWAATEGATNAGAVVFEPLGEARTRVTLSLDYEPEGVVEKAGDALNIVGRQAAGDLERFKTFIEGRGAETGGWRGEVTDEPDVGTPDVEDAAASRGDSGKAGVSGTAVAAGAVAAAAGAAAVAAATRSSSSEETVGVGEEDVVDILTTDHREVEDLLGQIRSAVDAGSRRDLADTMISELVRHAVAEEMYVYPAMKEHLPDGEAAVEHDVAEHKELERTMKELEAVDASDARFDALIGQLETTLADHVSDEESEQFPRLRAAIPRAELVELAGKVQAAKKLAPTRPHPAAPNAELFHKLVGPGVGLVDRLRDRLTGRSTG
jgi:hemerythrin superfamily protein/ribosome-associated toxin RatA of RatAB toxin-antitoxin module